MSECHTKSSLQQPIQHSSSAHQQINKTNKRQNRRRRRRLRTTQKSGRSQSKPKQKNVPCNARSLSACVRKRSNVTEERAVLMQRGSSNSRARHVDRNSAYYDADDCQLPLPSPTAASWDYVLECECGALDCSEAPRATSVCER